MPPALLIANLIIAHGIPVATALVEKWSKDEPGNPTAAEWLELLKSPTFTKNYDQRMADAAARHAA